MEEIVEILPVKATEPQFWGAIKIYTEKPHVVNRRMCGAANLWIGVMKENVCREKIIKDISQQFKEKDISRIKKDLSQIKENDLRSKIENSSINQEYIEESDHLNTPPELENMDENNELKTLKTSHKHSIVENTSIDKEYIGVDNDLVERIKAVLCNGGFTKFTGIENKSESLDCNGSQEKTIDQCKDHERDTQNNALCTGAFKGENSQHCQMTDSNYLENQDKQFSQSSRNTEEMHLLKSSLQTKAPVEVLSIPPQSSGEFKTKIPWEYLFEGEMIGLAVIRELIPKHVNKYSSGLEVVIIEKTNDRVTYLNDNSTYGASISPGIHYTFTFNEQELTLSCIIPDKDENTNMVKDNPSILWVQKKVLPKIAKWTTEVLEDGKVEEKGSLRLVDVQEYNQVYQNLKAKYAKKLIQMWPEVTDPLKFVYEDIAIATYLLLIWRNERNNKHLAQYQSFVDLGCGNGLLVYLLNSEGHPGIGIDIKKRNIWNMFPATVKLKEGVVEPSDKNLFPEYDWLIGNHSDELTPWLPVIAAKSKFTSRFFVIPCCAHDFSSKYRRRYAGRSQYLDYLEYVKEVGTVCGFEIWQDKLRIPSTKRICIIGQNRTYSENHLRNILADIDNFVKLREKLNSEQVEKKKNLKVDVVYEDSDNKKEINEKKIDIKPEKDTSSNEDSVKKPSDGLWAKNFRAREAVQQVRNCTQIEKSVRDDLITAVGNMLMDKRHIVKVEVEKDCYLEWDRGGSMTLGDIARKLEPQQRLALKKECGGLQTLLKNHRHMFSLLEGKVSLQSPVPAWKTSVPSDRIKKKLCWYHENHRKGCPLPSQLCTFAHGNLDLRTSGEMYWPISGKYSLNLNQLSRGQIQRTLPTSISAYRCRKYPYLPTSEKFPLSRIPLINEIVK